MLENKLFEIRDRATFIPVIAIKMRVPANKFTFEEHYLLRAAGYSPLSNIIALIQLKTGNCTAEPLKWNDRTMTTAHFHIQNNYEEMETGAVIDVEYILDEKPEPAISQLKESLAEYEAVPTQQKKRALARLLVGSFTLDGFEEGANDEH